MKKLTLRPSRKGDIDTVQGTFRGITAVRDDEVMGVAGVLHGQELQAFSTLRFDPRQEKRFVVQAVREYRKILSHYDLPIYAKPDPKQTTAPDFLKHVGFEEREDGLYVWTPSQ